MRDNSSANYRKASTRVGRQTDVILKGTRTLREGCSVRGRSGLIENEWEIVNRIWNGGVQSTPKEKLLECILVHEKKSITIN